MTCYSCNTASQPNPLKIERNYLGDTLRLDLLNSIPTGVTLNATSIVTLLVKSLDTSLVQSIAITDLVDGNNFAVGILKVQSNFAFLAGTYKLYLKIVTGTLTETLDINQVVVYQSI
jgi:hypothetical protein